MQALIIISQYFFILVDIFISQYFFILADIFISQYFVILVSISASQYFVILISISLFMDYLLWKFISPMFYLCIIQANTFVSVDCIIFLFAALE